ncbi:MAG TPA: hypothetical protein VL172_21340, partial [Kofleriaceae bacterium]|nr:hypothetical protein [Kofleriaceae bacterium]
MFGWVLALPLVLAGSPAVAPPPARAGDRVYLEAGGEWDFASASAPLPVSRLGAVALADVDRAAGRAAAPVPLYGDPPPGLPPDGWPRALAGAAVRHGAVAGAGDPARERIATVWAARRFTIGDELPGLALLVIDARYRDGLVLWINGREVARRNLPRDLAAMVPASRAHGPEWETFYVPVVPGLLVAGDNTLAVELRPGNRELIPQLDLRLAARAGGGRVVRGPLVQRVTATSAVIAFQTDMPVTAAVEYGPTPERGQQVRSCAGGLAVNHEIELTGLAPGKAVHYRVIAGAEVGPPLAFATAPSPGDPVRFVVYGDVRGGHATHAKVTAAVL